MSIKSDIEGVFDNYGITGFTVWLLPDGRLQANICRPDRISWICCTADNFEDAAEQVLNEFFSGSKAKRDARSRVLKITQKRRRDIDDLA